MRQNVSEVHKDFELYQVFILMHTNTFLSKNWFYFFFLIFLHAKLPPSFRMPRYWYQFFTYLFFKCFEFLKFTTPNQKSDMNNSIRIIFIKIITKINFFNIYSKGMSLISNKYAFIKIFIIKEYISIKQVYRQ